MGGVNMKTNNMKTNITITRKKPDVVDVCEAICTAPTVMPERNKGHWIKGKMWSEGIGMGETYGFYYSCSECNNSVQGGYDECGKNFCEKCGADMREPEDIPMEYFESGGR